MRLLIGCILISLAAAGVARSAEIKGAGSTFIDPVLSKWASAYRAKTGNTIAYQAIGSSLGINRIKAAAVDFGATDRPLSPDELKNSGLGQFPIVIGGVVPVVNLDGIKSGDIKFTGTLLADIYLGKIRRWDHPEIKQINPDLKLPSIPITVVHRTDGSGTTFNWVNYLRRLVLSGGSKLVRVRPLTGPLGSAVKAMMELRRSLSRSVALSVTSNTPMRCEAS